MDGSISCPWLGICGSCRLPLSYEEQLEQKINSTMELLQQLDLPEPEIYKSRPAHFRNRSEFRIWHEGSRLSLSMYRLDGSKQPLLIQNCPITNRIFYDRVPELLAYIEEVSALSRKLFRMDFLATEAGELLITLIYHKKLDENWRPHGEKLAQKFAINVLGRSKGRKIVCGDEAVHETITAAGREWHYRFPENCFTQPNGYINRLMVNWAVDNCSGRDDLLELYCGAGNFTLPLGSRYRRGVAIELARPALRTALYNAEQNGLTNLAFAAMSSEDFTQAVSGRQQFRRLQHIDLADFRFDTVLVDPPRAGLDPDSRSLAQQCSEILYISCNPQTLARDLEEMQKSHRVSAFALFDQFPYTYHLECGIKLVQR